MAVTTLYEDRTVLALELENTYQTYVDPDFTSEEDCLRVMKSIDLPIHGEVLHEDNYPGTVVDVSNAAYEGKKMIETTLKTYLDLKDEVITEAIYPGAILKLLSAFFHCTPTWDYTNERMEWTYCEDINELSLSFKTYEDGVLKKYKGARGYPSSLTMTPGELFIFEFAIKALIEDVTTLSPAPVPAYWGDTKLKAISNANPGITDESLESWVLKFNGELTDSPNGASENAVDEIFLSKPKITLTMKTRLKTSARESALEIGDSLSVTLGSNPAIKPYFDFDDALVGQVLSRKPLYEEGRKKMETELSLTTLPTFRLNFTSVIPTP